ncbi:MAG: hypothetical protein ACI8W0_001571, partial [Flavobacterium sp.]
SMNPIRALSSFQSSKPILILVSYQTKTTP